MDDPAFPSYCLYYTSCQAIVQAVFGAVLFELSTFFVYNPERKERINRNVTTSSTFDYLTHCASKLLLQEQRMGISVHSVQATEMMAESYDINGYSIAYCENNKIVFQNYGDGISESLYLNLLPLARLSPPVAKDFLETDRYWDFKR